jgi:hypothetical protein
MQENKIFITIGIMSLCLIVTACRQATFDTKQELVAYITNIDNGLTQQKTINGVDFTVTYRPTDLLVQQELTENPTREQVTQLRKKYSKNIYFNLDMGIEGKEILSAKVGNKMKFTALVDQLAFDMAEKVYLLRRNKDSVPLLDHVYPRLYGMGKSTNMLLVFELDPNSIQDEPLRLVIKDLGLGTGDVAFSLDAKKIAEQPSLEF